MSESQEKQARLVNALVKSNRQKKITWYNDFNTGAIRAEIGSNLISISEHTRLGVDSIRVEIYADGALAESFLDDDLADAETRPIDSDSWFETMDGLLGQSRRLASKADETLDDILKKLDG